MHDSFATLELIQDLEKQDHRAVELHGRERHLDGVRRHQMLLELGHGPDRDGVLRQTFLLTDRICKKSRQY